jgi:E3 ubiquitin-protein ligase UBR1
MPVFSDLRYICHNESVQKLIAHDCDYVEQFARTCRLFMCINPNRRAVSNHVEYETDAWISVFNVTLSLSRVIKVFGEAFAHASTAELLRAMEKVLQHIFKACVANTSAGKANPRPEYHDVVIGNKTARVVKFNVLEDWVSFHHSLHWLLAELLKHSQLLRVELLHSLGYRSLQDVVLQLAGGSVDTFLAVFDYPLRGTPRTLQLHRFIKLIALQFLLWSLRSVQACGFATDSSFAGNFYITGISCCGNCVMIKIFS